MSDYLVQFALGDGMWLVVDLVDDRAKASRFQSSDELETIAESLQWELRTGVIGWDIPFEIIREEDDRELLE